MGRRGKGKWAAKKAAKRARTDEQQSDAKRPRNERTDYASSPLERSNDLFEAYYQKQRFIGGEEWVPFMASLKSDLPSTFRVNESHALASVVKKRLHNIRATLGQIKIEDDAGGEIAVDPPSPMPWYPSALPTLQRESANERDDGNKDENDVAWVFSMAKRQMKRFKAIEEFRSFLVRQSELGTITRQEAVSMIPPLLLDVLSDHYVLDLCAAPGSKTGQLIEALHRNADGSLCGAPTGIVVANDVDKSRCFTLDHQIKRLGSANVLVTNYPAQRFPQLGTLMPRFPDQKVRFDRVLCDVPCTGDGTLRKNADGWAKWTPNAAVGIHGVQIAVAIRGASLLEVGGRMVYSTCSFNPIENEAVVAEVLRRCNGALLLVDVSDRLPLLKRRPGITEWPGIMDRDGHWYADKAAVPPETRMKVTASMFPPTDDEKREFHLERCLRLMPHDQDTGGFFVAVFMKHREFVLRSTPSMKKVRDLKDDTLDVEIGGNEEKEKAKEKEAKEVVNDEEGSIVEEGVDDGDIVEQEPQNEQQGVRSEKVLKWRRKDTDKEDVIRAKDERMMPFTTAHERLAEQWKLLREFYGITDDLNAENVVIRVVGKGSDYAKSIPHTVLFLANGIRDILRDQRNKKVQFINAGVRAFTNQRATSFGLLYRIAQEGITSILPFVSEKRIVMITRNDLVLILEEQDPPNSKFSETTQNRYKNLEGGPCLFVCEEPAQHIGRILCTGNLGNVSSRVQMKENERKLLLELLKDGEIAPGLDEKTDTMDTEGPTDNVEK